MLILVKLKQQAILDIWLQKAFTSPPKEISASFQDWDDF